MNFSVVKKFTPWVAISIFVIIVIVLFLKQRRSGYTPSVGSPINILDLQEFSGFNVEQKAQYAQALSESTNDLKNAIVSRSPEDLQLIILSIMRKVMQPPTPTPQMPTTPTPQMPTTPTPQMPPQMPPTPTQQMPPQMPPRPPM